MWLSLVSNCYCCMANMKCDSLTVFSSASYYYQLSFRDRDIALQDILKKESLLVWVCCYWACAVAATGGRPVPARIQQLL